MHYVVYKYLNEEGNCIYIGRTKVGVRARIQQHSNGTEKEIKALSEAETIMYTELKSEKEMCKVEAVLIDLIRPKYNEQIPKYENINLEPLKWKEYNNCVEKFCNENSDAEAEKLLNYYLNIFEDEKERCSFAASLRSKMSKKNNESFRIFWKEVYEKINKMLTIKILGGEIGEGSGLHIDGRGNLKIKLLGFGDFNYKNHEGKWYVCEEFEDLKYKIDNIHHAINWTMSYLTNLEVCEK